ncbi:MAG: DUF2236 domain-containing protein [Chitinophagaceae bacterium]|nr:DUF2236 domain-containing protein [Chitinophagaceae bacterium]
MEFFVAKDSVVRTIWGKPDTVLFIFAGAAAEFALNKSVDWLYFTGKLPADPIGRLFTTVSYAKQIVFSGTPEAVGAIDRINQIHAAVESKRGQLIPQDAYRDVLFMLVHYSISAFELLERKLTDIEKEEVVNVFTRVGRRMGITLLPIGYNAWKQMRGAQLENSLVASGYTADLYAQYRKHLGFLRYYVLIHVQYLVTPPRVKHLLNLEPSLILNALLQCYKWSRKIKMDEMIRSLLLPVKYRQQARLLDQQLYC